ncbi:MAG: hypothetical protein KC422_10230 [Trueperaceae bacterium]|nr:hypothetical protein [Trueperaceae bacterium]
MQNYIFAVDETPYCVWGIDLDERNLEFLNGIDSQYFEYLAKVNVEHLQGEHRQRAAIALRSGYHHGLETLFFLLSALIQAPSAPFAYCQKCYPKEIKSILKRIDNQEAILTRRGKQIISWEGLSESIHIYSNSDKARAKDTGQRFAKLWQMLARQYLDEKNDREYNNIKHGFRAKSGGFGIFFQPESSSGKLDLSKNPTSLGNSEFGSSFFMVESFSGKDPNFWVRRQLLNWNPEAIAYSLNLISMSINNVVSYLKIAIGIKPEEVIFIRPEASEYFDLPGKFNIGVTSANIDYVITKNDTKDFSREDIRYQLENSSIDKGD